jgi:hypothetical protein
MLLYALPVKRQAAGNRQEALPADRYDPGPMLLWPGPVRGRCEAGDYPMPAARTPEAMRTSINTPSAKRYQTNPRRECDRRYPSKNRAAR